MSRAEAHIAYGIAAVERLPGNVGYIDLRQFAGSDAAAARLDAAMDLVADTDALIIDLRANRGGGGGAIDVLIGRLQSKPVPRSAHLWRGEDGRFERMQPENRAYPPDRLYARPVYLLTANYTVSAAEAFAYDLQAAGRAAVVGETTRGGANPMNRPPHDLGAGLVAWISNGKSEHPITRGTPNGTGVKPDLPTAPEAALQVAYAKALEAAGEGAPARELSEARADPAAALRKRAPFAA
jgi:C-terminal processing protease CtpA/Prc